MKCPIDGTELVMSERQGVEIDYCPKCRGVWLDRGELDKIIERSEGASARPSAPVSPSYETQRGYGQSERYDQGHRKKKKSILGEIFDF